MMKAKNKEGIFGRRPDPAIERGPGVPGDRTSDD